MTHMLDSMPPSLRVLGPVTLGLLVTALVFESVCALGRTSNGWAVEVHGGKDNADRLAAKYGFVNKGQVSSTPHVTFRLHRVANADITCC